MSDERATRQTQKVWDADLNDTGRRLDLGELASLEAMHACGLLQQLVAMQADVVRVLMSIEGRLDRLETYLQRVDQRYPRTPGPIPERPALADAT